MEPSAYTPAQLKIKLQLGRNTVYRLIRDQRLRSIRINRKILIPKEAVDDFLSAR